jgi:hypothetical protein
LPLLKRGVRFFAISGHLLGRRLRQLPTGLRIFIAADHVAGFERVVIAGNARNDAANQHSFENVG